MMDEHMIALGMWWASSGLQFWGFWGFRSLLQFEESSQNFEKSREVFVYPCLFFLSSHCFMFWHRLEQSVEKFCCKQCNMCAWKSLAPVTRSLLNFCTGWTFSTSKLNQGENVSERHFAAMQTCFYSGRLGILFGWEASELAKPYGGSCCIGKMRIAVPGVFWIRGRWQCINI